MAPQCSSSGCHFAPLRLYVVNEPDRERALQLIREGYMQISRSYRMLARLPKGVRATDALYQASLGEYSPTLHNYAYWQQHLREWADHLGDDGARRQYLRCYAPDKITVSPGVFMLFRKLGGQSA